MSCSDFLATDDSLHDSTDVSHADEAQRGESAFKAWETQAYHARERALEGRNGGFVPPIDVASDDVTPKAPG